MKQKIKLCKCCGEPFVAIKRQLFCNNVCKQRYYRETNKIAVEIDCEYCGKPFTPNHGNRKYCTDDCAEEMDRIKRKKFRFKLKREFPGLYFNDLGSKGTSTIHTIFRTENGEPDFKREEAWLKREKRRLGL